MFTFSLLKGFTFLSPTCSKIVLALKQPNFLCTTIFMLQLCSFTNPFMDVLPGGSATCIHQIIVFIVGTPTNHFQGSFVAG